jgi:hypothetical protein
MLLRTRVSLVDADVPTLRRCDRAVLNAPDALNVTNASAGRAGIVAADKREQAVVLLPAGGAALEVRAQARERPVGVLARHALVRRQLLADRSLQRRQQLLLLCLAALIGEVRTRS